MNDVPARSRDDAAWGIECSVQPSWPARLAVLSAIGLQLLLPDRLIQGLGNRALIPALEGVLLLVLLIANPGHISKEESRFRMVSLALIALVTVANLVSLIELIHALLYGSKAGGRPLVYASVPIWLTNVIVFGLWYWELDRGGPALRRQAHHRRPDFLFPQMSTPGSASRMDTRLPRLSLYLVYECNRLQPDRHNAAHCMGEIIDDAAISRIVGHGRRCGFACREYLELSDRPSRGAGKAKSVTDDRHLPRNRPPAKRLVRLRGGG
jgi:hypothetical protein